MQITEILKQPEGRRLEFKQEIPRAADLAKTIVAFANDAGGDIYIGFRNEPRELIGIPEPVLIQTEEQISSIIHDYCAPLIVPDISVHNVEDLYFLRIQIHRGSDFPYHLKSLGIKGGTFIRIGSTNRLADDAIIAELERKKRNISFDGEPVYGKDPLTFSLDSFRKQFKDLSGEELDSAALLKLQLVKNLNGHLLPTNALVLLSDFDSRQEFFPYSKIECARFKGISTDEKLDDKSITAQIGEQPAEALKFIQRHIDQGSVIEGVYTKVRWEYPLDAIREALRNAVVHRDYSLTGKDIKVAIYDDMVEITSPGTLPPSIDFQQMDARQSDIRNRIIAPVFKRMGLIDQWGNGLKIISNSLKSYPEIEFRWFEKGLQFQLQFIKKNFRSKDSEESSVEMMAEQLGSLLGLSWDQAGTMLKPKENLSFEWQQIIEILSLSETARSIQELMDHFEWKNRTKFRKKFMTPLLGSDLLQMTIPGKPKHPKQKYYLNSRGKKLLAFLNHSDAKPDSR